MGYVPPPPPPDRNAPPPPDRTGELIRAAVRKVRRRWWEFANWKRVGCWLRLGHELPLRLDYHSLECRRCGHRWLE